jgi:hypothetical protein
MELELERAAFDLEEAEGDLKRRFQALAAAKSQASTTSLESDPRCVRPRINPSA